MEISKILKKEDISKEIMKISRTKNCGLIDAAIILCEEKNLEFETISKLLTANLKQMIEIEAEDLNMIKKTKERLLF